MDRLDLLLLGLSLAGIAGLGWASEALEPPLVRLADLRHWADHAVAAEVFVARASPAGSGAQVLRLTDGTASAAAFWASQQVVEGAQVRAEGTVARHRGQWELLVRTLAVLAPAGAPLTVAQAARLAPGLAGREVSVAGELAWPEAGEPLLHGDGATLRLDASRGQLAGLADSGVRATGELRYDAARAAFVLEAREVERA